MYRASTRNFIRNTCLSIECAAAEENNLNNKNQLMRQVMLYTHTHTHTQTRGSADKSLARQGKKQATATKLGIYWTYSPRSSIKFLARCSNYCKPLKKFRILSVQPNLRGNNDLCVGRKVATFQLLFQSRKQVVVRRGQIRRIRWVIKTIEAQVGQFLLSCKCPVSRGIFVQEQDPLVDLPAALVFPFKVSFNCTSRDE